MKAGHFSSIHGKLHQKTKSSLSLNLNSVHPVVPVPEGEHRKPAQKLQSVQHVQHQKPVTFFRPVKEAEPSEKEGKQLEEDATGRMMMMDATRLSPTNKDNHTMVTSQHPEEFMNVNSLYMSTMLEDDESDRISKNLGHSVVSSADKEMFKNSEFSANAKPMASYNQLENTVVLNQTEKLRKVESSSFDLKDQPILKPAESMKKDTTLFSPKKDLLEEKLASLQRQIDAALRQLAATSKPKTVLRSAEGRLVRLGGPSALLKSSSNQEREPITLARKANVEGSKVLKDRDGRGAMNLLEGEPIRYFYFI